MPIKLKLLLTINLTNLIVVKFRLPLVRFLARSETFSSMAIYLKHIKNMN